MRELSTRFDVMVRSSTLNHGTLQMATKFIEHMSRASRLRALNRLLGYALAESKAFRLAHLDKLLGAAALAVSDELEDLEVLSPKSAASYEQCPPKSKDSRSE